MAAHNLDDEDTVVGLCRGVQTVDGVRRNGNRGIETEGVVGGVDVVVNGLRNTDDRDAIVRKELRALERAFTADGNERVYLSVSHVGLYLVDARLKLIRVQAAGTEDGTAAQEDTVDFRIIIEVTAVVFHETNPTVLVADDGVAELVGGGAHDGANNGIETGAIATGGKYCKAHSFQLTALAPIVQQLPTCL